MSMTLAQACSVIAQQRRDALIVATMGAMFAFDQLGLVDGRLSSVPLMGGAAGLGVGLALARPDRPVIVVDGDASLLLELGGLATVVAAQPGRFLHVLIHNGTQFSGLANLDAPARGFDFAAVARSAGYASACTIDDPAIWAARFAELLAAPGPQFVELIVTPPPARTAAGFEQAEMPDKQFQRMGEEAQALQHWLAQKQAPSP